MFLRLVSDTGLKNKILDRRAGKAWREKGKQNWRGKTKMVRKGTQKKKTERRTDKGKWRKWAHDSGWHIHQKRSKANIVMKSMSICTHRSHKTLSSPSCWHWGSERPAVNNVKPNHFYLLYLIAPFHQSEVVDTHWSQPRLEMTSEEFIKNWDPTSCSYTRAIIQYLDWTGVHDHLMIQGAPSITWW